MIGEASLDTYGITGSDHHALPTEDICFPLGLRCAPTAHAAGKERKKEGGCRDETWCEHL
jgi:hypothetical protein